MIKYSIKGNAKYYEYDGAEFPKDFVRFPNVGEIVVATGGECFGFQHRKEPAKGKELYVLDVRHGEEPGALHGSGAYIEFVLGFFEELTR